MDDVLGLDKDGAEATTTSGQECQRRKAADLGGVFARNDANVGFARAGDDILGPKEASVGHLPTIVVRYGAQRSMDYD